MILPDVLAPGLIAVFCGTAPGRASKEQMAYYAKPGNKFWPALHDAGITPRRLAPKEYRELLMFGCGLTDICKTSYGNDDQITIVTDDRHRLARKIKRWSPGIVAFTSKNAASAFLDRPTRDIAYGLQETMVGETALFVLPSPSGQAGSFWNPEPWRALGAWIAERRS